LLCILAYKDDGLMRRFDYQAQDVPHTAVQWVQAIRSMW
jgi:hypothetical protein